MKAKNQLLSSLSGGTAGDNRANLLLSDIVRRTKPLCVPVVRVPEESNFSIDMGDDFKVAMISYPVFIQAEYQGKEAWIPYKPEDGTPSYRLKLESFDHFDICVNHTPNEVEPIEDWCRKIQTDCRNAGEEGAKFILMPELGFPNFWGGKSRGLEAEERKTKLNALKDNLIERVQQISTDYGMVIISGSSHNSSSFENEALIFFPGCQSQEYHKKITSAKAIGENCKVAYGTKFPVYSAGSKSSPVNFCVLICSDAFDLNMYFRQILMTTTDRALSPHLIFVPSYYHKADGKTRHAMVEACRQLSRSVNAIIVFVNQSADNQRHVVFHAGEQLAVDELSDRVGITDIIAHDVQDRMYDNQALVNELHTILGLSVFSIQ